jgi:hypothetical protein
MISLVTPAEDLRVLQGEDVTFTLKWKNLYIPENRLYLAIVFLGREPNLWQFTEENTEFLIGSYTLVVSPGQDSEAEATILFNSYNFQSSDLWTTWLWDVLAGIWVSPGGLDFKQYIYNGRVVGIEKAAVNEGRLLYYPELKWFKEILQVW